MDTIELSNLNRQFLFRMKDIGKSKAEIAAQFVRDRIDDPSLNIKSYFNKIQDKPIEFYQQFNLVISGLDSIEARVDQRDIDLFGSTRVYDSID